MFRVVSSLGGFTYLYVFSRRIVNTQVCRDSILYAYIHPFPISIGDDFLLQDDNAWHHIMYDNINSVANNSWPVLSSDMNPIRSRLVCFRKTYGCSHSPFSNLCQACNCLVTAMALTSISYSTASRIAVIWCIASRGDPIPYWHIVLVPFIHFLISITTSLPSNFFPCCFIPYYVFHIKG